jgi:2-polyprenyl-3-methyl-5-hydroxy-6-metoxy-1,4-benzoquinol methylase
MDVRLDPEENETHALLTLADPLAGKRVLEVGCGDGRLTWRYASGAGRVTGIDPDAAKLERARHDCPAALRKRVEFHQLGLEEFAAGIHSARFDLVLLAWSL